MPSIWLSPESCSFYRALFIAGAILGVGASLLAVYRFLSKVN